MIYTQLIVSVRVSEYNSGNIRQPRTEEERSGGGGGGGRAANERGRERERERDRQTDRQTDVGCTILYMGYTILYKLRERIHHTHVSRLGPSVSTLDRLVRTISVPFPASALRSLQKLLFLDIVF